MDLISTSKTYHYDDTFYFEIEVLEEDRIRVWLFDDDILIKNAVAIFRTDQPVRDLEEDRLVEMLVDFMDSTDVIKKYMDNHADLYCDGDCEHCSLNCSDDNTADYNNGPIIVSALAKKLRDDAHKYRNRLNIF